MGPPKWNVTDEYSPRKRNDEDLVSDYIEALGGDGATGWDSISNAFQMAREYFSEPISNHRNC